MRSVCRRCRVTQWLWCWYHMESFLHNNVTWGFPFQKHDDCIKWKHFRHYWPFVWGIHRSLVNTPHKAQWCGALVFSLICTWINGWENNGEAYDLTCHCAHYDVTVMGMFHLLQWCWPLLWNVKLPNVSMASVPPPFQDEGFCTNSLLHM